VRWVSVHDRTGTHRDEYFFTTDQAMAAEAVIAAYTGRWDIETTFEELRAYLGLETTRGHARSTVLRAEPCLFGLYTIVVLLYAALPSRWRRERATIRPGKVEVTFSDAITAVRRRLWLGWVFAAPGPAGAARRLPAGLRRILLNALAPGRESARRGLAGAGIGRIIASRRLIPFGVRAGPIGVIKRQETT
jgi:hypothetical protein